MHKIKSGERKTPHVEGLLFAIKISNIWVFERKRKNKDKRFGDFFEIYRIKEKKIKIGDSEIGFFRKRERVFIGEGKERRRRWRRPEDEANRERKKKGN